MENRYVFKECLNSSLEEEWRIECGSEFHNSAADREKALAPKETVPPREVTIVRESSRERKQYSERFSYVASSFMDTCHAVPIEYLV